MGTNFSIGGHLAIGACSFINRDIPAYSIAAGVPARIIGKVIAAKDGTIRYEYIRNKHKT
jgi:serine acetyltransferase